MGEPQICVTLQQNHHPEFSNILGEFYVDNHHYLIICPEPSWPGLTDPYLQVCPLHSENSVAGNLKICEKNCLIVEAAAHALKGSATDITRFLTERELQIVQLIAQGHSNKQIARQLSISTWTVSTHLRRVFAKLGVDSRAAMVYQCAAWLNNLEQLMP